MSYGAAQSLLEYKEGNWPFSYKKDDLEVHVATLPTEDRDFSLNWCLDSGASCHFCNESTKLMSMKKCNISVSTAEKGEVLQAVGVGNGQITVLTASSELTGNYTFFVKICDFLKFFEKILLFFQIF